MIDSLREFLATGGWVIGWIFAVAAVLWTVVLERAWYLWRVYPRSRRALLQEWASRAERASWRAQHVRRALIAQLRGDLEAGLPILRVIVPMSPLLGLLGTVTGMLEVFDAMQFERAGGTRVMADGIAHAMLATLTGLAVAITGLAFSTLFQARVQAEAQRLGDLLPLGDAR